MKYYAIDIGSTYIKTALLDLSEKSISLFPVIQNPPAIRKFDGKGYEVDLGGMFHSVKTGIDQIIDQYGQEELDGILFSTQMHGFLIMDPAGEAVTQYISWQDTRSLIQHPRGDTYLEHLRQLIPQGMMQYSGVDLKAGLGMCNAYTLRQEGHCRILHGMRLATLGSYFIYRLTGHFACHITNAAPMGFADAFHKTWNSELISLTGFSDLEFPELIDEYTSAGTYRGVRVYPDLGDQQCCVLGGMTHRNTDMTVNIGTGAQLCYIRKNYETGPYECRPYFEGLYLPTITRLPGGRNMEVIMRFLKDTAEYISGQTFSEQTVWEQMRKSYGSAGENPPSVSLGFFPETLGNSEGRIDGIQDTNFTMANLCTSLYERMADTYFQYYLQFAQENDSFQRLVFTGGVSHKDELLRRCISERIGLPCVVSPCRDEVFAGLFLIALIIDRQADSLEAAMKNWEDLPVTIKKHE